jgi:hypothetical protein
MSSESEEIVRNAVEAAYRVIASSPRFETVAAFDEAGYGWITSLARCLQSEIPEAQLYATKLTGQLAHLSVKLSVSLYRAGIAEVLQSLLPLSSITMEYQVCKAVGEIMAGLGESDTPDTETLVQRLSSAVTTSEERHSRDIALIIVLRHAERSSRFANEFCAAGGLPKLLRHLPLPSSPRAGRFPRITMMPRHEYPKDILSVIRALTKWPSCIAALDEEETLFKLRSWWTCCTLDERTILEGLIEEMEGAGCTK